MERGRKPEGGGWHARRWWGLGAGAVAAATSTPTSSPTGLYT
jgi:hypothetical protein